MCGERLNGRQIDYSCGFGIKYDLKMILRMLLKIFGEKSYFIKFINFWKEYFEIQNVSSDTEVEENYLGMGVIKNE